MASTPKLSKVPRAVVRECGRVGLLGKRFSGEGVRRKRASVGRAARLARAALLDLLGEYVKLDPKTLGVGSYQHDLDAKQLRRALDGAVEDAVAVSARKKQGELGGIRTFRKGRRLECDLSQGCCVRKTLASRNDLRRVGRLGPKTSRGLVWMKHDERRREVLDATRIHPDDYDECWRVLKKAGVSSDDVQSASKGGGLGSAIVEKLRRLPPSSLVDLLCDPCLAGDARRSGAPPPILETRAGGCTLKDCSLGRRLRGDTRRSTAPFGAFVDIGVGVDGLLHSSQFGSSLRLK